MKIYSLIITIVLQFRRKSVTIEQDAQRKGAMGVPEILENLASNLTDFLIYLAIAMVMLIGLFKCVLPVSRAARRLRHGIHLLETSTGEGRPVWQDVLFLGKEIQGSWRRFLVNAEQLDARGLNCNVEDYINDETVIYTVGHAQLA